MPADLNRLTADHAVSVTAKSAVSDLDATLLANTVYAFEFVLRTSANAATVGIQHALRFSGTITRLDAQIEYWSAATTKASLVITNATTSPQNFNPVASQGNVIQVDRIVGIIEVGATGGTFGIDHGSETATLTTVHRGSYLVISPV